MIEIRIGNVRNHMDRIRDLATKVYDPQDVSSLEKYLALYDKCPEGFICAFDSKTKQVVGYIIALPLDPDYFEKTTTADYTEADLTPDVVKPYTPGNNYVYLFSIVSQLNHPERLKIFSSLSKAYVSQLRKLSYAGYFVLRATAIALSESGQNICRRLDMEEVGVNPKGVVFYGKQFHKHITTLEDKIRFLRKKKIQRMEKNLEKA